jgi:D-arabinose 1-dehydrogenase-like Zn-dependent alcohol dehydrogenase
MLGGDKSKMMMVPGCNVVGKIVKCGSMKGMEGTGMKEGMMVCGSCSFRSLSSFPLRRPFPPFPSLLSFPFPSCSFFLRPSHTDPFPLHFAGISMYGGMSEYCICDASLCCEVPKSVMSMGEQAHLECCVAAYSATRIHCASLSSRTPLFVFSRP